MGGRWGKMKGLAACNMLCKTRITNKPSLHSIHKKKEGAAKTTVWFSEGEVVLKGILGYQMYITSDEYVNITIV